MNGLILLVLCTGFNSLYSAEGKRKRKNPEVTERQYALRSRWEVKAPLPPKGEYEVGPPVRRELRDSPPAVSGVPAPISAVAVGAAVRGPELFECSCGEKFSEHKKFLEHRKVASVGKGYACHSRILRCFYDRCSYTCPNNAVLERHIRAAHILGTAPAKHPVLAPIAASRSLPARSKCYYCGPCRQFFYDPSIIAEHFAGKHHAIPYNNRHMGTPLQDIGCRYCRRPIKDKGLSWMHGEGKCTLACLLDAVPTQ